jgi:hypothetical protein
MIILSFLQFIGKIFLTFDPSLITGTLVHYYVTCKREAWLYSRRIHADQWDENILMGKALAFLVLIRLFAGIFFPNTSNSVNKSGFVLLHKRANKS